MKVLTHEELEAIVADDAERITQADDADEEAWWLLRGVERGEIERRAERVHNVYSVIGVEPTLAQACRFMFMSGVRYGLLIADERERE